MSITLKNSKFLFKNVKFKQNYLNFSSDNTKIKKDKFIPFQEKIEFRKKEAKKSIVVQVQNAQIYKELYTYCSSFGSVNKMLHYTVGIKPMHFIIVEFNNETEVKNVLSSTSFKDEELTIPVNSMFVKFKTKLKNKQKLKNSELTVENGLNVPTKETILQILKDCTDVSNQIQTLYDLTKLTDIESRLRFITARQIETSISGMFPKANVLPFGSSVNGFGKMGCDLDVVLTLNDQKKNPESQLLSLGIDKGLNLRHLETLGDLLDFYLPGCCRVRKILQARVPIIKYYHQFTDCECDVSMLNTSGVHMSDFLYLMGGLDERVRPLVFAVRKWAYEVGLTNTFPGRWISNFSLTLMVLFFLQTHTNPILPSLNNLVKSASTKDIYITEEGVNCTFLRDIKNLNYKNNNEQNLEELFFDFFEYYSQFDFKSKSICLNEGFPLTKPEHSPLYIINPLERGLNVSKNVAIEELNKFSIEVKNAAWNLQSTENFNTTKWGILTLFDKRNNVKMPFNFSTIRNGRLMQVKELFDEEQQIEYKNVEIKKEIQSIKKDNQQFLKGLKRIDR